MPTTRTAPGEQLRLLAVHAHPDDESSKGAATMAKYAHEGARVLVVSCTGGERGSILNPAMERPEILEHLPDVRIQEMATAADILGVEHQWLGFVDSGLPEGDPLPPLPEGCFGLQPLAVAAAPLVKIVREFRPHVVLTYDEKGGYPHPDHIKTHEISLEAYTAAGDPTRYREIGGAAWQPLKLYYHLTFHKARLEALHDAALRAGIESPYADWLQRWEDKPEDDRRLTTRIDCAEYFPLRDRALLAHATQVDPTGRWFGLPVEMQAAAWPTEDYELARTEVPAEGSAAEPETDLFAGIRQSQAA
jgi:mycothiol S-conjugate amidase